ncbi:MAG: flagellar basal body L-ring protein FlgH, partial [Deltaproteobacteria bacterium]|nr:flagellar basal body L-ring protein FlgH [Deltaproteobacteria bacterium]
MKRLIFIAATSAALVGCSRQYSQTQRVAERVVPAVEFSKAVKAGTEEDFSILNYSEDSIPDPQVAPAVMNAGEGAVMTKVGLNADGGSPAAEQAIQARMEAAQAEYQRAALRSDSPTQSPAGEGGVQYHQAPPVPAPNGGMKVEQFQEKFSGDPRYLKDGLKLHGSIDVPSEQLPEPLLGKQQAAVPPPPPPGSSAPYYMGQMTANPSLWPDEAQGASLFRDMRAFQPMDIVTIIVNERAEGAKRAQTDAETKSSLLAAVANFFGEELEYVSDNAGLDPTNLINATTESKFEGEGNTTRSGSLKAKISAVILEVLPNGLLRLEGTKIMSVDHEEEIMVISGLVRPRDIDALNQTDSSRIANMRIDFYGRGVVAEQTFPGWFT